MSLSAIISIFLLIYLRKALKNATDLPPWFRYINYIWIAFIAFPLMEEFLRVPALFKLVWTLILLYLIFFISKRKELIASRSLIVAILPLAILSFIKDLFSIRNFGSIQSSIQTYLDTAQAFAFIWMGAYLLVFRKQQKALARERQKREEEERINKEIAARKDALEAMVTERTAEIMKQKEELQHALHELTATQTQLIHAEKMASLGELTAGIAHEIQNPLNFVNNFSDVNNELIDEMQQALDKGDLDEVKAIVNDIRDNNAKITHHGKRADAIVKGMLQHSRTSTGQKELTDINALADEYLRLSYHGLRAKDKSFNAGYEIHTDTTLPLLNVIPQDIGRVILNLLNNAFYAVAERKKQHPENYKPTVVISTRKAGNNVEINVQDNGGGIPAEIIDKIFQPFFTTKPTGQGTGLGLSLSYDIITKGHGGELKVETKEGEGTTFSISLPLK